MGGGETAVHAMAGRTGRGGYHMFYRHPGGTSGTAPSSRPAVESSTSTSVLTEALSLLPRALHENGERYRPERRLAGES